MGSFGSGRRNGHGRTKVESCHTIDANELNRAGCLRDGSSGVLQWARDGVKVAAINLRTDADGLHLGYRSRVGSGDWEAVAETVRIVRLPCQYGGTRPYFLCPHCGQRVTKLYGPGRYFWCRHCYALTYGSQSEGSRDRAIRRAGKIKQRLGGGPAVVNRFPPRPRGMWQRTYERLRQRALEAETFAAEAFDAWLVA
jgi:hypothetical protein